MDPISTKTPLLDPQTLMEKVAEGCQLAKELKIILDKPLRSDEYSVAQDLIDKILSSFMGSISMMNRRPEGDFPAGTLGGLPESYGREEDYGDDSKTSGFKDQRGCYKRRKTSHTSTKLIPNLIDDGHAWRKYGQKVILNAKHQRNYYRCTHRFDQGCQATKQVQKTEDEPPLYRITYHGLHTCQTPLHQTPHLIFDPTHFNDSQFLLSFTSTNKSRDNHIFPDFAAYNPMVDQVKSPPPDRHMSPDLTAIGSSAPTSVFSPGCEQGDGLSYFSATSAPNNAFEHMDIMESFHGFSGNVEFEFEHCYK